MERGEGERVYESFRDSQTGFVGVVGMVDFFRKDAMVLIGCVRLFHEEDWDGGQYQYNVFLVRPFRMLQRRFKFCDTSISCGGFFVGIFFFFLLDFLGDEILASLFKQIRKA